MKRQKKEVSYGASTETIEEVIGMIADRPASVKIEQIAREAGVSVGWVYLLMRRQIPNPGIVSIYALRQVLQQHAKRRAC